MAERSPPGAGDEKSPSGSKTNGIDPLPTPPISNIAPSDYSDAPSADSQHSNPHQRRNKRGGRKKKDKAERLQSVSELEIPKGKAPEHDAPSEPEWRDGDSDEDSNSEDYDAGKLREARSSRPSGSKQRSPNRTSKADTGIRAFNLKRAESSGGGRPIGVTIERPKSKKKAKKETKKAVGEEGSEEEEEEEETEQKKCLSIRFDLNLEVEIFLKAKIKGDVTMTFLE